MTERKPRVPEPEPDPTDPGKIETKGQQDEATPPDTARESDGLTDPGKIDYRRVDEGRRD